MPTKDDDGPAFGHGDPTHGGAHGISLREYFAANADVPWNSVMETLRINGNASPTIQEVVDFRARIKFREADAMLKARKMDHP